MPLILSGLPAILQVALLLFFVGLLQQLWNVQDHTTVETVSVIVGIAVLVVTATTIIPAHFSRRGDCKRFTPFYSPQAWIYLFMYQQVVRLCVFITQKLFRMQWNSHYTPTPFSGSWAAYDLEYLTHENEKIAKSQTTDEDQVTSIHLVLRSAFEAFGNVKDIGNSIFWCLQSPLPRPFSTAGIGNKGKNMGSYVTRLGLYVFYGEKTNPQLPSFEQSCPRTTDSPTVLSSPPPEMTLYNSRGQLHSELLIRDANHILSTLESMPRAGQAALEDGVTRFEETCMKLCNFEGMFYAEDENLGKHYPILKHVDQGLIFVVVIAAQEQVALVLQKFFQVLQRRTGIEACVYQPCDYITQLLCGMDSAAKDGSFSRHITRSKISPILCTIMQRGPTPFHRGFRRIRQNDAKKNKHCLKEHHHYSKAHEYWYAILDASWWDYRNGGEEEEEPRAGWSWNNFWRAFHCDRQFSRLDDADQVSEGEVTDPESLRFKRQNSYDAA